MNGWVGKLLRVNLTNSSIKVEGLSGRLTEQFLGGRGLASKVLFDEVDAGVEPLCPENKVIFMTGPLTGTGAPTGARYMVMTKSPLTGAITCSNSGGKFPSEMKQAGYDGIIIQGKAKRWVYLCIQDGVAELRDASDLIDEMKNPSSLNGAGGHR